MKIDFSKSNGELTVAMDGRLDTTTAPELERILMENYGGTVHLTFNCERLSYISSAGLRVLLTAHKKMKGAMCLTGVSELVMDVLEMTGFADMWEIK
jgi:anti-sigma B factor antagonist